MNTTKVTRVGWFSRIGGALKNIVIGAVLALLSVGGLALNEGRAVKTYRALQDGAGAVKSVPTIPAKANEGALVHVSGTVKAVGEPRDEMFGISAPALRIERVVEMYQWVEVKSVETDKKVGGAEETKTTYTYEQRWEKTVNDSASFQQQAGHVNPAAPVEPTMFSAPSGTLGEFLLTQDQLVKFGSDAPLPVAVAKQAAAQATFPGKSVWIVEGVINVGDPVSPKVGDVRISFTQSLPGIYSVVAKQVGRGLVDYEARNGRNLFLVQGGQVTAQAMFDTAKQTNKIITWVLRAIGLLALFIGFMLVLSLVGVLGDVVPLLGSVARFGTSAIAFAAAVLLGSITIAVSWFAFRPMLSLCLIAAAALIAGGVLFLRKDKAASRERTLNKPILGGQL